MVCAVDYDVAAAGANNGSERARGICGAGPTIYGATSTMGAAGATGSGGYGTTQQAVPAGYAAVPAGDGTSSGGGYSGATQATIYAAPAGKHTGKVMHTER